MSRKILCVNNKNKLFVKKITKLNGPMHFFNFSFFINIKVYIFIFYNNNTVWTLGRMCYRLTNYNLIRSWSSFANKIWENYNLIIKKQLLVTLDDRSLTKLLERNSNFIASNNYGSSEISLILRSLSLIYSHHYLVLSTS